MGEGGVAFRAPRAHWRKSDRSGEWVFFGRDERPEIWILSHVHEEGEEEAFRVAQASFRWLDFAFFQALPTLPPDFYLHVDPALRPQVTFDAHPEEAMRQFAADIVACAGQSPNAEENARRVIDGEEPMWVHPLSGLDTRICHIEPGVYYVMREPVAMPQREKTPEGAASTLAKELLIEVQSLRDADPQRYKTVVAMIEAELQRRA